MNPIKTQYPSRDHYEPLRKLNYALLEKLLVRAGASPDKLSFLEPSCSTGQECETEKRKAQWVEYYINVLSVSTDHELLPNIKECVIDHGGDYTLLDPYTETIE